MFTHFKERRVFILHPGIVVRSSPHGFSAVKAPAQYFCRRFIPQGKDEVHNKDKTSHICLESHDL